MRTRTVVIVIINNNIIIVIIVIIIIIIIIIIITFIIIIIVIIIIIITIIIIIIISSICNSISSISICKSIIMHAHVLRLDRDVFAASAEGGLPNRASRGRPSLTLALFFLSLCW